MLRIDSMPPVGGFHPRHGVISQGTRLAFSFLHDTKKQRDHKNQGFFFCFSSFRFFV